MKNRTLILATSLLLMSCNMNPGKEARIQKLETEIEQSLEQIKQLEKKVKQLEEINAELKSKMEWIETNE